MEKGSPVKVLITGAAGQLGADLVKVLGHGGCQVIPAGRADFDITDLEATVKFITGAQPDAVVHSAAFTDVDACESQREKAFAVNSLGARNVAVAARKVDAKLFYISTDYVFDGLKEGSYFEFDRPNPLNVYGRSKLWGEELVKEQLQKFFIIRTAWLYGRVGRNFVKTMLMLGREKWELQVVNDQRGTPTYTGDLALQIKELLPTELYGTYHCSSQGACTWYEFAVEIFRLAGLSVRVKPVTTEEFRRPAKRPKNSVLENFALNLEGLDIMPHWKESLEKFMRAFKREEMIL
ncbi:MAG: dTDP-4-dehydrorhamnose reductase [Bacillota bacterium]